MSLKNHVRYALKLSYDGTDFFGWQIQPEQRTVQGEIEQVLQQLFQNFEGIVGCGRTDTGVHAQNYFAHFDIGNAPNFDLKYKMNRMLPDDISIDEVFAVEENFHARYDAVSRKYKYRLHGKKNVFERRFSTYYSRLHRMNWPAIKNASKMLLEYDEFAPFCKSKSGVEHKKCRLDMVHWEYDPIDQNACLTIQANRFLRGMVRLIVGACLNIGEGRINESTLRKAMNEQQALKNSLSAPPMGLTLEEITYK